MSDFSITQQTLRDDTLLLITGKMLDNSNAPEMVTTITSALSRGFKYVIIDMQNLEFLSSAGVGSILGTVEDFREAGGDLILCNLSGTILRVLEVLDLHEYLTIRDNQQEAAKLCGITQ